MPGFFRAFRMLIKLWNTLQSFFYFSPLCVIHKLQPQPARVAGFFLSRFELHDSR
jgi:hypothetical protein